MNLYFTACLFLFFLFMGFSAALDSTEYIHMETMKSRNSIKKIANFIPHPDTMHELTFAIKQSNADKMHGFLMERSTPGQPLYQQWMTNDEVRAWTANPEASAALLSWFTEHGIAVEWMNRGQEYFRVRTHIGTWERLLRTSFHEYREYDEEVKEHVTAVRAESYSLPVSISVHVSAVFGAVDFPVKPYKFEVRSKPITANKPSFPHFDSIIATDNHLSVQASAVTGYVEINTFASSTCAGTALGAVDYAIGPCIPMSQVTGSSSFKFVPSGSSVLINYFTDTACTTLLRTDVPAVGVCTVSNNYGRTAIVFLSTTSVPIPSFFSTSLTVIRGFYQGACQAHYPIVVEFIVEDGTLECPNLQCASSYYQQFGFLAPVNYTLGCNTPAAYAGVTIPSTLQTQYQIPIRNGSVYATQSIFATINEHFSALDLQTFQNFHGITPQTVAVKHGHSTPYCVGDISCIEANLDVQYITAISQNTNTTYWYVNNTVTSIYPFLTYLLELSELTKPPLVNSISYGKTEQVYTPTFLDQYAHEALKLGLMGVTILVSTGDDGVAGPYSRAQYCNPITPGCACYFNSSSATYSSSKGAQTNNSWSGVGYFPWFPASCPYVTAVGATKLTSGTSGSEIACSSDTGGEITSGGGFSSYYAILDWQTTAVSKYFQLVKKGSVPVPASGYNPLGRGIPDVALNGFSYQTIINGFQMEGSGTSASTPLFAAMISTINGVRLAAGKGPVGFINPTLYANPTAFNDITSGNNRCSAGSTQTAVCCNSGFYASTGWDPVTGLGSIQYSALYNIFSSVVTSPDLNFPPTSSPVMQPVSTQLPSISWDDNVYYSSKVVLSRGAIIGIIIAVLLVVACLIIGLLFFLGFLTARSLGMAKTSQKSSLNDGSWQTSDQGSPGDRLSSGPSRVSFGVKGVDDAL